MAFLFPIYYAQNPIGTTSEPCEHTFGELRRDEREFTMYRLLQLVEKQYLEDKSYVRKQLERLHITDNCTPQFGGVITHVSELYDMTE